MKHKIEKVGRERERWTDKITLGRRGEGEKREVVKQKKRGREREGRGEGEGGSLGETVVSSACTHLHTSCHGSSTQPTWWHHLVGLSGWEGGEREGKERGEEGPIILHKLI